MVHSRSSGTFQATLQRILGGNRNSNEDQLGGNNRLVWAFVLVLLFIYVSTFLIIHNGDSHDLPHLTISQVTVYMYAIN